MKMSRGTPRNPCSLAHRLGHEVLGRLHAEHGPSFYLIDIGRLRGNVNDLLSAFRRLYPKVGIGHSYKTNYIPTIAHEFFALGAYPEVVSELEYAIARRLGMPAARTILNGPVKSDELLERALLEGALVNADSIREVERLVAIAKVHPDSAMRVGLRCNFAMPGLERSRFGIDENVLCKAAERLQSCPTIRLEGLHCHLGGNRAAASYTQRIDRLIALADAIFYDAPPHWLDIGGGFAGPMPETLRAQFSRPPATYTDYAEAIAPRMAARYGTGPDAPELILEPGMGLLSNVLEFVSRVEVIKSIGAQDHAIVAGTIYNVKPTLNKFDLPVEVVPARRPAGEVRTDIVSGATCMEIDIMHSGLLADLAVGDDLVFRNTGAYTVALNPPFIVAAPAILAVRPDLQIAVARRAERIDDILATYTLDAP